MTENDVKSLKNILFIDIETVSQEPDFDLLNEPLKSLWLKKAGYLQSKEKEVLPDHLFYLNRASIYSEFGKIICIGVGGIVFDENLEPSLRVKMISGESEAEILKQFKRIVEKHKAGKNLLLCAHNGKEFDFPYICRRMLVNGISLPTILQISGKKPWEIKHIDTLDLWKFGDHKHYVSLELLITIFGIPDGETEVSGDQINELYYKEKNLLKIARYCADDVILLTQLYMKMNDWALINENNIEVLLK
ncbi:3'-5' exonuclease [Emticicia sp. TH156]|uniref:3'-5' exonuclease n=1 Tax=Emticicia sp. TH156 TaxID=2067454 RepID=UPI000C77D20A|nr:3'-5' exonuclease [Emticicia sp. TH156]PLK46270.1 3'-5' exonuclease [Emticicia sp. TH156]